MTLPRWSTPGIAKLTDRCEQQVSPQTPAAKNCTLGNKTWGSRRHEDSCPVRAEARDTGKDRATATARHDTERPNTDAVQGGLARMREEEGRTRQWPAAGGFGGGEHAAAAPRGRGRQNGAQTLKKEDLCVREGEWVVLQVGVDAGARVDAYACVGVYTLVRTRVPG